VGQQNAEFFNFKPVLTEFVRAVQVANTMEAAKRFLDTQTINLVVLNLRLENKENAAEIIQEIRAGRPNMTICALGWAFQDIVAHNCWCLARGIDGTITVDQFRDAIGKIVAERKQSVFQIAVAVLAVVGICSTTLFCTSPFVRFLGVFWVIALAAEFAYCVLSSREVLA